MYKLEAYVYLNRAEKSYELLHEVVRLVDYN